MLIRRDEQRQIARSLWLLLLWAAVLAVLLFLLDETVNPRRSYNYHLIGPDDRDMDRIVNEWGRAGWEIVYMRRATDRITDKSKYEILLKLETTHGPFDRGGLFLPDNQNQ